MPSLSAHPTPRQPATPHEVPMRIAILDDWNDTIRTLACFRKLDGISDRNEFTVFSGI